jgi:uncharacterized protein YbjT (DUF2867 family)
MSPNILITGATGNVGQEIIHLLSIQKHNVFAAVRNPIKAQRILGKEACCVLFDFINHDTFVNAFNGIDKLFLVRPPAITKIKKIIPALDAAKAAGVKQIVFLSIIGANHNRIVPHYAIERAIEQLDIPAVFLRASFFMQNLNTTHCNDIRLRDRLFMPAGNGKTSFIDVRDIAAVAVKVLTEPANDGHSQKELRSNRAYELTGGKALDYQEVAEIFTTVLKRLILYTKPSLLSFIWQMSRQGFALPFVLVMAGIYTTTRFGLADTVTSDVQKLLDRPPLSMQNYVEDYQYFWLNMPPEKS